MQANWVQPGLSRLHMAMHLAVVTAGVVAPVAACNVDVEGGRILVAGKQVGDVHVSMTRTADVLLDAAFAAEHGVTLPFEMALSMPQRAGTEVRGVLPPATGGDWMQVAVVTAGDTQALTETLHIGPLDPPMLAAPRLAAALAAAVEGPALAKVSRGRADVAVHGAPAATRVAGLQAARLTLTATDPSLGRVLLALWAFAPEEGGPGVLLVQAAVPGAGGPSDLESLADPERSVMAFAIGALRTRALPR